MQIRIMFNHIQSILKNSDHEVSRIANLSISIHIYLIFIHITKSVYFKLHKINFINLKNKWLKFVNLWNEYLAELLLILS